MFAQLYGRSVDEMRVEEPPVTLTIPPAPASPTFLTLDRGGDE